MKVKPSIKTVLVIVFLLGLAGAVAPLLVAILEHDASLRERRWFGHLAALTTLVLLAVLIGYIHQWAVKQARRAEGADGTEVQGILIGADNRLSTSKLSAFAWSWVIAWAILSLAFAYWVGEHSGWNEVLKNGIPETYYILLGGPFVALVSAKALVSTKVLNGTLVKPQTSADQTSPTARISQAFSDDTGQTDLIDTQYLLFGFIALLVFIVRLIQTSGSGFPELPDFLVGLTSLGATAYIANKAAASDAAPNIERVMPEHARTGDWITVYGTNLLTVSQGGKKLVTTDPCTVLFGGSAEVEVSSSDAGAHASLSGSDYMRLRVPPPAVPIPAGDSVEADVSVRNPVGVMSEKPAPFWMVA